MQSSIVFAFMRFKLTQSQFSMCLDLSFITIFLPCCSDNHWRIVISCDAALSVTHFVAVVRVVVIIIFVVVVFFFLCGCGRCCGC